MIASRGSRGFTLMELLLALAVIGIITAVGTPMFLSAWRAATLRAGAEEMVSALNEARQAAVTGNQSVCVTYSGDVVQYRPCAADPDAPPREIRLTSRVTVSGAGAVSFDYLGGTNPPATYTYTVTNPQDDRRLRVIVASSGRMSIAPW